VPWLGIVVHGSALPTVCWAIHAEAPWLGIMLQGSALPTIGWAIRERLMLRGEGEG
jgi:hypothetical protein